MRRVIREEILTCESRGVLECGSRKNTAVGSLHFEETSHGAQLSQATEDVGRRQKFGREPIIAFVMLSQWLRAVKSQNPRRLPLRARGRLSALQSGQQTF